MDWADDAISSEGRKVEKSRYDATEHSCLVQEQQMPQPAVVDGTFSGKSISPGKDAAPQKALRAAGTEMPKLC